VRDHEHNFTKSASFIKVRFLRLILLNLGLMFPIGLGIWWFQTGGDRHQLVGHMLMSFIHSNVYGMSFGLTMRPWGERLGTIRFPLNWISIIGALLLITILSTFIIQVLSVWPGIPGTESFLDRVVL